MPKNFNYIQITPDIIDGLKSHRERTGVGPHKLLRGRKDRPTGLSGIQISAWIDGKIKSARKQHVNYVLKIWEEEGTVDGSAKIDISKSSFAKKLFNEINSLGIGGTKLLRYMDDSSGLTSRTIDNILCNRNKTIVEHQLRSINVAFYRLREAVHSRDHTKIEQPSCKSGHRIAISNSQLVMLKKYRDKGFLPGHIFKQNSLKKPSYLNPNMISGWLSGRTNRVNHEHLKYVLEACEELDKSISKRVEITPSIYDEICFHKERTGFGPKKFVDVIGRVPDGFNSGLITGWLSRNTMTARQDYLNFVLEKWREMPNKD